MAKDLNDFRKLHLQGIIKFRGLILKIGVNSLQQARGLIFDIQRYCVEDGPGIRTTVFLKGCPLACDWCANPESQNATPDLMYRAIDCTLCEICVKVCKQNAPKVVEGKIITDRKLCRACGDCAKACPNGARQIAGEWREVGDVLHEVEQDILFYHNSGGGITVSGGEPLFQAEFTKNLLKTSSQGGIHTVIETCGFAPEKTVLEIAEYVDLFLFDIKHLNDQVHKQRTGVTNKVIINNLKAISKANKRMIIRYPFIPGFNDNQANFEALAQLLNGLNGVEKIELLPYHDYGREKYKKLDREYLWEGKRALDQGIEFALDFFHQHGIEAGLVR